MSFLSKVGKALAKPVGLGARIAGGVGGFMTGGPMGAVSGWEAGDKIGNIAEDALGGHSVKKHLVSNLTGAALGGAGMYGASTIPGDFGSEGNSGLMSKIGHVLKDAGGQLKGQYISPDGKIDFGKVIGTGGAISSMIGQAKQRKSVEKYNNADIQQRNDLMSKILASPNYNLPAGGTQ